MPNSKSQNFDIRMTLLCPRYAIISRVPCGECNCAKEAACACDKGKACTCCTDHAKCACKKPGCKCGK